MIRSVDFKNKLILSAVFLSPFNTLLIGNIYITISDFLFLLLLPLIFFNIKRLDINNIFGRWAIGYWLITIGFLISFLFARNVSLNDTFSVVIQYGFMFVYLPVVFLMYDKNYTNLLKAYIYGVLAVIVIGIIIQMFFSGYYVELVSKGIFIGTRRFGSFLGSNGLAKTIATCIPILLFLYKKQSISKISLFFHLTIYILAILKAASNGGTMAIVLSLTLFLLFEKDRRTKKSLIVYLILILLGVTYLIFNNKIDIQVFTDRVSDNFIENDLTNTGSYLIKIELMKEAIRRISSNPFIGLGVGNFMKLSTYNQTVHNSYLLMWVEGGLLAITGIIVIILSSFRFAITKINMPDLRDEAVLIVVFIIIFMINIFTGTHIYQGFRIVPLILILYVLLESQDLQSSIL